MTVQELRDLLTAAAPGPWYLCGREGSRWIGCDPHDSPFERSAGEKVWAALSVGNFAEPDAALLVAAVNALPALLDVAEAAAELITWLQERDGTLELEGRELWDALNKFAGTP